MPRPRHKNKTIIRLSSHPSRQSLCFNSKLVVVVVVIGLMETRLKQPAVMWWHHEGKISARVGWSTRLYMKISAKVGASINPVYMKEFHKSQRDPNPSRRVNPGLEKGYPARRVDPLRRVEVNPGSCKGGLTDHLFLPVQAPAKLRRVIFLIW